MLVNKCTDNVFANQMCRHLSMYAVLTLHISVLMMMMTQMIQSQTLATKRWTWHHTACRL